MRRRRLRCSQARSRSTTQRKRPRRSLESRNLPVLRVDLGDGAEAGWRALADAIEEAVG